MRRIILLFVLAFIGQVSLAQEQFKLVKATSERVAIRDGNQPITRWWEYLTANVKPVVYHIAKINQNRRVTFYTDIDSISFDVAPNSEYNFKVLLNSKDTCFAQISTVIPTYYKVCKNCMITSDTIPFVLENDHYIHIKGKVNNSATLDFIFDSGAGTCVLNERGQGIAKIKIDGQTDGEGSSGFTVEQTSSSNHLQLSSLNWDKLSLTYIDYKGSINTDGVIGYNVFEDKVLEIDYEKSLLIVHDKMPLNISGYNKHQIRHDLNGTFIEATLSNGVKEYTGWYLFDTGGSLTVEVSGDYSKKNNLYGSMKNLGKGNATGNGKGFFESEIVELPTLNIFDHSIKEVPIHLASSEKSFYGEAGIIGNNILKRFNTFIDYPNATIYVKPNSLMSMSFKKQESSVVKFTKVSAVILALIAIVYFVKRRNALIK